MSLNYTVETKIKAAERYLRGEGNSCCLDNRITGQGEQKSTQRGRKPEKGGIEGMQGLGYNRIHSETAMAATASESPR